MTKFIEQRVEVLENEVAELKLIVHELRGKKSIEPSTTNTVEDIIEFEGNQYRKVDREAQVGDTVVFTQKHAEETHKNTITAGKPYEVIEAYGEPRFLTNNGCRYRIYEKVFGRTPETVDVYELIESKPLTPNQQRAEIIEKAKKFFEKSKVKLSHPHEGYGHVVNMSICEVEFVVNEKKRTVVALLRWKFNQKIEAKGIAKCNPTDVFNEHIGKAIALGRALGLDVSEFEQAVQPTKAVKGMTVYYKNENCGQFIATIEKEREVQTANTDLEQGDGYWKATIINDTNAIYEVI
ncbi:hypothetical protein LSPCS325_39530 [Lysinibacillus sp. CTST325]